MLVEFLLFFVLAAAATTLVALVPGATRLRAWLSLPLGALALTAAGVAVVVVAHDRPAGVATAVTGLTVTAAARRVLPRAWTWLAAQLFTMLVLAAVAYLVYVGIGRVAGAGGALELAASLLLLAAEAAVLGLSASYAFEILDVLGRRRAARPRPDAHHRPWVAVQVPTYNEPVEVVADTLRSLARLRYDRLLVQVVDNNTPDPAVWRPVEALCRELGPRFQFIHLERWPGFKAGALNEATRRLPPHIEVVGIVDADYVVDEGWLEATVGHFVAPEVAFVQTPQDYRDWEDDGYLRGLYYSYRYFFSVTMPARAHRNAIIFAGTMGLIRRSALDEIGGWSTEVVTEDAEASLRMLGLGYRGVYDPTPYGRGMMPLSFDGLKKQRFRWALGGVQILRLHWRELLPLAPHRLRLSRAQRAHYLLGSLQWSGDLLMAVFTAVLLASAAAVVAHHRLPITPLEGAVLTVPVAFLVTGVMRAVWAIRATTRASWRDAERALRVWFALSWVVSLAVLRGAIRAEMAFLRTPKHKGAPAGLLRALASARGETAVAVAAAGGAAAMLVTSLSVGTALLALLLLFQGSIYGSAAWASAAAEGITLTPTRRAYLRSPQTTGDWPRPAGTQSLALGLAALASGVLAVYVIAGGAGPAPSYTPPAGPQIKQLPLPGPAGPASPAPTPSATASPIPTASPTAAPTPASSGRRSTR